MSVTYLDRVGTRPTSVFSATVNAVASIKVGLRMSLRWLLMIALVPCIVSHATQGKPTHIPPPRRIISLHEDIESGHFSDLSPKHDVSIANPADGSTGNTLQETLIEAYLWGIANGSADSPARATVVVASQYPVHGSRILIPGNVDLVCSDYSPETYTGGCKGFQTDAGTNTATGGSPIFMADFAFGFLASDHTKRCSIFDSPQQAGCLIIPGSGGSIAGFTLYGGGATAGGADVGIRIAANNFHVQDIQITGFFGGPGIQYVVGVNDSFDWNYGTNVDTWWCGHPDQLTSANLKVSLSISDFELGGLELPMVDGEESNNQFSTGCGFSKGFRVGPEYPHLAGIHLGGSGNRSSSDLGQTDGIALLLDGQNQSVTGGRFEYAGRESIYSTAVTSIISGVHITSGCLDPNLANLRPGAPNSGIPAYPSFPTLLQTGAMIIDSNGNVEQVVYGNQSNGSGNTDLAAPFWPSERYKTVKGRQLIWENQGPWQPNSLPGADAGLSPALASGLCFGVTDLGQGNAWSANSVDDMPGVNGPSFYRGSYFIPYPGNPSALPTNMCDRNQPDLNGNGQCWWGGDLFSNGGPRNMPANGMSTAASGGGTAWIGNYSGVKLTDPTAQLYNNFQGMSQGQDFWVISTSAANVIASWGANGSGSVYGHPSLLTCGGVPLTTTVGTAYLFHYDLSATWAVTQQNCPLAPSTGGTSSGGSTTSGSGSGGSGNSGSGTGSGSGNSGSGGSASSVSVASGNGTFTESISVRTTDATAGQGASALFESPGGHAWKVATSNSGDDQPDGMSLRDATTDITLLALHSSYDGNQSGGSLALISSACIGWTSQDRYADRDSQPQTCVWQPSKGTFNFGNGTPNDASGTLNAHALVLDGVALSVTRSAPTGPCFLPELVLSLDGRFTHCEKGFYQALERATK